MAIVVTVAVVVALFCTYHDIKVMGSNLFHVLGIGISSNTILIILGHTVPSIIVIGIRILGDYIILLTFRVLTSIAGVQMQVFKTMNLIVSLNIAREVIGGSFRILHFQESQRILRSIGIIGVQPFRIEILRSL